MTLVLDTGALLAVEADDRTVRALLRTAERNGIAVITTTAAVAQAWRDGSRQARLARLLSGVAEIELTRSRSRAIGVLLDRARQRDVVDASVVEASADGDEVLTSDPDDISGLADTARKRLIVTQV